MKIDIKGNLVTLRYKDHERYKDDIEENKDVIDNTIEYDDEWVINIKVIKMSTYAYRCPSCGGEFNTPAVGIPSGTAADSRCPFCGRKMEGI